MYSANLPNYAAKSKKTVKQICFAVLLGHTRAIPKVSGLDMDILDSNIFHNLYISETNVLYEL